MTLNLGSLLADSTRRHGQIVAAIDGDERLTYAELDQRVRLFAAELLSIGVGPNDKVALMAQNSPSFTVAYYGILYAGGVAVSLNTLQTADEVAFQLNDSEAVAIVFDTACSQVARDAAQSASSCRVLYAAGHMPADERAGDLRSFDDALQGRAGADVKQTMPDDTAVILYTSGTTGKPKGAELTHFNLFYNAKYVCERAAGGWPAKAAPIGPGHVGLAALPLYHIFGQTNVQNALLLGGATVSYLDRFTPAAAVHAIARDAVTFFPGVPTMYFALLHDESSQTADLSSLQFCVSGGAPMPAEVKRQFEQTFGVSIQEGYGLTETSPLATVQEHGASQKSGTIGKPIDGVDLKLVDDQGCEVPQGEKGEILIRGHCVMKGYYNRPEATAEAIRDGWFYSGDVAYVDEEGDYFIVDRKKDMILRGGFNVYPREVEEVLYEHPAVREAVVIGMPDERYGEEVKAVISLKPDFQVTEEEIVEHCKAKVAAYKYPRVVEIRDELPKGPTGKLLKRALRDL